MKRKILIKVILSLLPKERIFVIKGDLGSGKTKLIKLIAKKLEIKEKLLSPTFSLWQRYYFKYKNKNFIFNHLDLYRVTAKDILKINLKHSINKVENIFFIEWGEKLKPFLMRKKISFVEVIIKKFGKKRDYVIKVFNNESSSY